MGRSTHCYGVCQIMALSRVHYTETKILWLVIHHISKMSLLMTWWSIAWHVLWAIYQDKTIIIYKLLDWHIWVGIIGVDLTPGFWHRAWWGGEPYPLCFSCYHAQCFHSLVMQKFFLFLLFRPLSTVWINMLLMISQLTCDISNITLSDVALGASADNLQPE